MGGREATSRLDEITKYFLYVNLKKQIEIDYLTTVMPLMATLEPKEKQKIFETITGLYFGEDNKKEKLEEQKSLLRALEKEVKNIRTLGAVELQGEAAKLKILEIENLEK